MESSLAPVSLLMDDLAAQVPPETVPLARWCVFPPPLGAWLTAGKPGNLRGSMIKRKVSPASLLHWWLIKWPFRLKVETYSLKALEGRSKKWPDRICCVYARDRDAMAKLFGGKLSADTRLACARYGAWRAMAALEVDSMSMVELQWAGLAVHLGAEGARAFCGDDAKGIEGAVGGWWLLSDNCRSEVKGVPAFKSLEMAELIKHGAEVQTVAWTAKSVFAEKGSKVSVREQTRRSDEAAKKELEPGYRSGKPVRGISF